MKKIINKELYLDTKTCRHEYRMHDVFDFYNVISDVHYRFYCIYCLSIKDKKVKKGVPYDE